MPWNKPVFEYRIFGLDLMARWIPSKSITLEPPLVQSDAVYILSRNTNRIQAFIEDNVLYIKEILDAEQGIEQWLMRVEEAFPVAGREIEDSVLPLLGIRMAVRFSEMSQEEFLDRIVATSPELVGLNIRERRQSFVPVAGVMGLFSEVLVNGAYQQSVALTSADLSVLQETCKALGLEGHENTPFPLALKRIIGWTPLSRQPEFSH